MSKADTLLKKAAFFERLSLYGDRKSYLQALAQDADAANKRLAYQALQILQNLGIGEDKTKALGAAAIFGRVDIPAMQREIQNATLTGGISPLSHQREIDQLNALSAQFKAPLTPEQEDDAAGGEHITFQPDPKKDRITAQVPIRKEDQEAVFRFATINGLGLFTDKATGYIGPQTRKALEAIKDYFKKVNPQNARMTDQQAIQAAVFNNKNPQT